MGKNPVSAVPMPRSAKAIIERLKLALSNYESDYGDYPPTSLADLDQGSNGLNDGIESLVRCLSTTEKSGPYYDFPEKDLDNLDGDTVRENFNRSYFKAAQAFEYLDPWGNPYIYFHNRDYEKPEEVGRYTLGGKKVPCVPGCSEKTEQYHGFNTFQIWSCGPDGVNQGGGGDDINSWD